MKSRFTSDHQDSLDGFFDAIEDEAFLNLLPSAATSGGNAPTDAHVEIPLTPALTSEATEAQSAQSGATTVVAATSGGITINLLFDAAAMAAPASFRAGIQQAASILTSAISDKITVNIGIDYSGTGGGAAAGPDNGLYESYSSVRADLINGASPGDTTFNALPNGASFQGQSNVAVWNAQLKLFGLLGANDTTTDDGSATFATDISGGLLVGVALHELTHAMGRVPYGPPYGSQPDIFDFFRFTSSGTRMIAGGSTAPAAYFSVDGGNTKLADYGQNSDPADFLNSGVQGGNDPFNEFYSGSTSQSLSVADKEQLDALGVHLAASAPPQPDLSEYVGVSSTTVAAGGSVTIDTYAMNLGNGVSGASTARIYLSTDSTINSSDTVLATLSSGTLATVSQPGYYDHQTLSVTLPGNLAPGTYYIGGIADYNDQVNESNYANNTYNVVPITVTAPPQPDLSEYVGVSSTSVAAGGGVTIDAYDMNIGNGVSGASTARIYLSTDPTITTSDTVLATLSSAALATVGQPGYYDHRTVSVTLPSNLAPGTYYIGGIADYNNQVSESSYANNTYDVVPITVTAPPQPDLTEYVSLSNTIVAAGGSSAVDAYDMNIGNGVSGASTARIYLSTDPTIDTSDTMLATLSSGTLATVGQPGYYDHQTVSVTLPSNLAPGTYYIGGIANYNNQVSESNATNNTYDVVKITVPAPAVAAQPDLTEYVSVSNTTVAAGGSITVDAYDMNIGNGVSGSSTARIYLSTNPTIDTSDTVLATLSSGALATVGQPGYYDHQTFSVTLPGNLAPGTYYIGGIANYNNLVSESNATNNTYDVVKITVPAAATSPVPSAQSAPMNELFAGGASGDTFVFATNFGNETIVGFRPDQDHIQIDHGVFATVTALLANTHDDGHGNAVIAADANHTITVQGITTDTLQHHLNDFLIA